MGEGSGFFFSQPNSGTEAMAILEYMVNSGLFDIITVDSVAGLTSLEEDKADMGAKVIAGTASLMSNSLKKLVPAIDRTGTTVIFINQIREKPAVMFGCLHGDTMIPLTDGRYYPIKKIVDEQIHGKVWSYNETTNKFEEKEIIDWHYNGKVENNRDYIHFETSAFDSKNGSNGITVTPNHQIMTQRGWVKAKDIKITDQIVSKYKSIVNGTLADFLYGTLCGDCHLSIRNANTGAIKLQDNNNNAYVQWKINKLNNFFNFTQNANNKWVSNYCTELAKIKDNIINRDPRYMLRHQYSDMGLALWYMDDGHFDDQNSHYRANISVKRFANRSDILDEIKELLGLRGLEVTIKYDNGSIKFNKANTIKLFKMISKFVPQCMQYKLGREFRGLYEDFELSNEEQIKEGLVDIKLIRIASDKQMRTTGKYDLTIEDNHNYIAGGTTNGLLVHNSPETTPGGRALKFFSSVRLRIARQSAIMENSTTQCGHTVGISVKKNKVAPPFKSTAVDLIYYDVPDKFEAGFQEGDDLMETAKLAGIIQLKGSQYQFIDQNTGEIVKANGKVKFFELLDERPEIRQAIVDQLLGNNNGGIKDGSEDGE